MAELTELHNRCFCPVEAPNEPILAPEGFIAWTKYPLIGSDSLEEIVPVKYWGNKY